MLWQFAQEHPDFGFSVALFYNMGDKYYANQELNNWFVKGDGWEDALARAIVWCIEHNALPYNHLYNHPRLDLTNPADIPWELSKNDEMLRVFLARVNRQDLASRLGNLIALPYSIWPTNPRGKDIMLAYVTPEGKPVRAILEADYHYRPRYVPAPYTPEFDRVHVPRMTGLDGAIDLLVNQKNQFPLAQNCALGPIEPGRAVDTGYLKEQVGAAVAQGRCPEGVYVIGAVQGASTTPGASTVPLLFRARQGLVEPLELKP